MPADNGKGELWTYTDRLRRLAYQLEEKNFLNKCSQINQSAGGLNMSLSRKDEVIACPSKRLLELFRDSPFLQ
jgi:hypothetical protein